MNFLDEIGLAHFWQLILAKINSIIIPLQNKIYVGPEEPIDENTSIWIDTDANADTAEEWRASLDVYSKAETIEAINNTEIGGTNLIRETGWYDDVADTSVGWIYTSGAFYEYPYNINPDSNDDFYKNGYIHWTGAKAGDCNTPSIKTKAGEVYTLSFRHRGAGLQVHIFGADASGSQSWGPMREFGNPSTTNCSYTFTIPSDRDVSSIYIVFRTTAGEAGVLGRIKLERGTIATDWSPNPEDLSTKIETLQNMEIGGRNLLQGTQYWDSTYWKQTSDKTISGEIISIDASSLESGYAEVYQKVYLTAGKTYTLSAELTELTATASGKVVHVFAYDNTAGKTNNAIYKQQPEVGKHTGTFTVPEGSSSFTVYVRAYAGVAFKIKNIQLEEGNKATAWGPSPEDIKKESRVYNLLDNSDFTNPVNQKMDTSYSNAAEYTIDRWRKNAGTVEVVANVGVVLSPVAGTTGNYFTQYIGDPSFSERYNGKILTFSANTNKGLFCISTTFNATNGWYYRQNVFTNIWATIGQTQTGKPYVDILVGKDSTETLTVYWAALYEGKYTTKTLPTYQPKGYAHEFAECQRYYRALAVPSIPFCNNAAGSYIKGFLNFEMRVAPTVAYNQIYAFYGTNSYVAINGITAVNYKGCTQLDCTLASSVESNLNGLIGGNYIILDANL